MANKQGIRIHANLTGTLNIIPVDYFVKVSLNAMEDNSIQELNIVDHTPSNSVSVLSTILETVGITNFTMVDKMPSDLNQIEKMYYRSVSPALTPYIASNNAKYDASRAKSLHSMDQANVRQHIPELIGFALEQNFVEGY